MAEALALAAGIAAPPLAESARRRAGRRQWPRRRARRAPRTGHPPRRDRRPRGSGAARPRGDALLHPRAVQSRRTHPALRSGGRRQRDTAPRDRRPRSQHAGRRWRARGRPRRRHRNHLRRARGPGARSHLALRRHRRLLAPVRPPQDRRLARWLLRARGGRRVPRRPATSPARLRDARSIGCGAGPTWWSSASGPWPPTGRGSTRAWHQKLATCPAADPLPAYVDTDLSLAGATPERAHIVFAGPERAGGSGGPNPAERRSRGALRDAGRPRRAREPARSLPPGRLAHAAGRGRPDAGRLVPRLGARRSLGCLHRAGRAGRRRPVADGGTTAAPCLAVLTDPDRTGRRRRDGGLRP